jgi:hypothetical protein
VLIVTVLGTIAFGVLPNVLFEFAEGSAASLGAASVPAVGTR